MKSFWGVLGLLVAFFPTYAGASLPRSATSGGRPTATAAPLDPENVDAWLDGYMPYALANADVPGAVVAIVKDGRIVVEKGFGLADVARNEPVDPRRTLFRVGSVSKVFTWTAVMQLVEQHRIDLDADVNRYLDFRIPPFQGQPVTMRELMTHTAGFEEARRGIATFDPNAMPSLRGALIRRVPPRIYAPGTTSAYSNYGAALAGYIVERVAGEPFEQYVARHILEPLGMRRTTFVQPVPRSLASGMAQGYVDGSARPGPFEMIVWRPAGALSTTGDDMARFMAAHLDGGVAGNTRILAAASTALMQNSARPSEFGLNRMLLGFYELRREGHRVIGHHGDTVQFHSLVALYPQDRVGLFVAFNGPGRGGSVSAIRDQLFERFNERYFPYAVPQPSIIDPATATAHDRLFASSYASSRGYRLSFLTALGLLNPVRILVHPDGTISLGGYKGADGQPKRFRELTPFRWSEVGGHDRLVAIVEHNRIVRLATDGFAPIMVMDAVPEWRSPTLLGPAFVIGTIMLLLVVLAWPGTALARRYYGHPDPVAADRARSRARSLLRATALIALAAIGSWLWLLGKVMNPTGIYFLGDYSWAILITEALTMLGLGGALIASAWASLVVWQRGASWVVRLVYIALLASTALLFYTAWFFRMMSMSAEF